jgi:hypothetical protein
MVAKPSVRRSSILVFQLNIRIAAEPPAISKHVEEERVILTPSEHEALSSHTPTARPNE